MLDPFLSWCKACPAQAKQGENSQASIVEDRSQQLMLSGRAWRAPSWLASPTSSQSLDMSPRSRSDPDLCSGWWEDFLKNQCPVLKSPLKSYYSQSNYCILLLCILLAVAFSLIQQCYVLVWILLWQSQSLAGEVGRCRRSRGGVKMSPKCLDLWIWCVLIGTGTGIVMSLTRRPLLYNAPFLYKAKTIPLLSK